MLYGTGKSVSLDAKSHDGGEAFCVHGPNTTAARHLAIRKRERRIHTGFMAEILFAQCKGSQC